jgi:hypothetical protein
VYELTISPGAGAGDLISAAAELPGVVYTDHRPLRPHHPAAVLTFRAVPDEPAGVLARPSHGPTPGWSPTARDALRAALASAAIRDGRCPVCASVDDAPDAVAAGGSRRTGSARV